MLSDLPKQAGSPDPAVCRPVAAATRDYWPTPFHRLHQHLVDLERQNDLLRQQRGQWEESEAQRLRPDPAPTISQAAREELVQLNRMVAHDLRQPLNVIYAYSQAILSSCESLDDSGRVYLQQVLEGTIRMNRFIGALVDFSRVATVEPRRETVDLSELARGVLTRLEQGDSGHRVEIRVAPGITAQADYDLMALVLDHLLRNAWQFSAGCPDPRIEFLALQGETGPVYQVRDNGIGIEPKRLERLFIPLDREGDENPRGFGLGLATAARIVRRHGGRIWAETSAGPGATFCFTLT